MYYELKAIFHNKITLVCLFICILLGIQGFVNMEQVAASTDRESMMRILTENIMAVQEEIDSFEEFGDDFLQDFCDTQEKRNAYLNWQNYMIWLQDSYQEEYNLLKSGQKEDSKKYELVDERFGLIHLLCRMNLNCIEAEECIPAEKVFADQLEKHSDLLRLDELPFSLEKLVDYTTYFTETMQEDYKLWIPDYYEMKRRVEILFETIEYSDTIDIKTTSPYTLLVNLFSPPSNSGIIFGTIFLLFPTFYMVECRKNRSRQLQELRPQNRKNIAGYYYKNIVVAIVLLVICGVGIPMLIAGMRYGWEGLNTLMEVDAGNFNSWIPYEHYDRYQYWNLSPIYEDYQYRGIAGSYLMTMSPMKKILLWQFLICVSIIAVLKVIFLSLTGFIIGYFGKKQGKTIFMAALVAAVYGISQFVEKGMRWNPFSVKSVWLVTTGGSNMTWLNAVVILVISIMALVVLLLKWNGKRDYC